MSSTPSFGRSRPTALDVARRAGVSRTTVSFVLNGRTESRGITAATAERVLRAAAELGYVPDRTARLLRTGLSDLVVFVAPGPDPLPTIVVRVLSQVADLLAEAGLQLVIKRTPAGERLRDAWRVLSPAAVLGLEVPAEDVADVRAAGTAAVSIDLSSLDEGYGRTQAQHLLASGHAALGYVAPAGSCAPHAERRLAAVRRACADAGAPPPVVVSCGLDVPSASAAVQALVEHGDVSAVCTFNDEHAFAVLAGMAELGLRAPEDLAVIGADNDPLSAVAVPALTTVDPGTGASAEYLFHRVVGAIEGLDEAEAVRVLVPQVRVRRTA